MDRDNRTEALIANLMHNHELIRQATAEAIRTMERASPVCRPRSATALHSDCTLPEMPQSIDLFNGAVKMRAIHENNEMHLLDLHYPHELVASLAETDWSAKASYKRANEIFERDFHCENPRIDALKQEILEQFAVYERAVAEHMRIEEEHWSTLALA
jgi:hypothetical protein